MGLSHCVPGARDCHGLVHRSATSRIDSHGNCGGHSSGANVGGFNAYDSDFSDGILPVARRHGGHGNFDIALGRVGDAVTVCRTES